MARKPKPKEESISETLKKATTPRELLELNRRLIGEDTYAMLQLENWRDAPPQDPNRNEAIKFWAGIRKKSKIAMRTIGLRLVRLGAKPTVTIKTTRLQPRLPQRLRKR